ncbi:small EDRK-rich factor 2-like [Saimiri boliviensis]|uniref:small EDRK-rich factor 2-like n=1 Tax=Saimiri boliviensis TaxID=27679 RepID=UPI00193CE65F|nr:small EDRK-rich factor 2-like [Saimiri boliviensis boliviensis]
MTCSNQRELTHQKNMKKQSNSVKGRHQDDRLFVATSKQSASSSLPPGSEIMQRKQKKANKKKEEPN